MAFEKGAWTSSSFFRRHRSTDRSSPITELSPLSPLSPPPPLLFFESSAHCRSHCRGDCVCHFILSAAAPQSPPLSGLGVDRRRLLSLHFAPVPPLTPDNDSCSPKAYLCLHCPSSRDGGNCYVEPCQNVGKRQLCPAHYVRPAVSASRLRALLVIPPSVKRAKTPTLRPTARL